MEDFVTFEIAQKLKEKGFPQHMCDDGYLTEEDDKYDIGDKEMIWIIPDYLPYIAAPTISQVLKWLREKHEIHIAIDITKVDSYISWSWCIYDIESGDIRPYDGSAESFEKAALAGIEYVLNNLI